MDDSAPPPYSETDPNPQTLASSASHPRIQSEEATAPTSLIDPPPPGSAAAFFDSRVPPLPSRNGSENASTLVHNIVVDADLNIDGLLQPDDFIFWIERGVDDQDWATFVNYVRPPPVRSDSTKKPRNPRRNQDHAHSYSFDGTASLPYASGSPFSTSEPSLHQPLDGVLSSASKQEIERISNTVKEWNANFFTLRNCEIILHTPLLNPSEPVPEISTQPQQQQTFPPQNGQYLTPATSAAAAAMRPSSSKSNCSNSNGNNGHNRLWNSWAEYGRKMEEWGRQMEEFCDKKGKQVEDWGVGLGRQAEEYARHFTPGWGYSGPWRGRGGGWDRPGGPGSHFSMYREFNPGPFPPGPPSRGRGCGGRGGRGFWS